MVVEGDVELGASIARYGAWRRRGKVATTRSSYRFGLLDLGQQVDSCE